MAACALLLELAYADDVFSDEERAYLDDAVVDQFGLDHEHAAELLRLAQVQRSGGEGLEEFARLVREHYSMAQRGELAEVMWGLVRSDGTLAPKERQLMTRISALLELGPGFLAAGRERWEGGGPEEIFD